MPYVQFLLKMIAADRMSLRLDKEYAFLSSSFIIINKLGCGLANNNFKIVFHALYLQHIKYQIYDKTQ